RSCVGLSGASVISAGSVRRRLTLGSCHHRTPAANPAGRLGCRRRADMDSGLARYLAEEVAVDHADGLLSRREALRRLGLLGVTGVTASSLLASCAANGAP